MNNVLREQREWLEKHPGVALDEALTKHVTYGVERFEDAMQEASEHFAEHHDEAGDGIELDFDFGQYLLLEKLGMLQFVAVRSSGKLVGYHVSILSPSLKHRGKMIGSMDMFYLDRAHRFGMTGYKLIAFAVEKLRERGVVQIVASVKGRHEPIFLRLGFHQTESVYVKVI